MTHNQNTKTVFVQSERKRVGRPDKRDRRAVIKGKQSFFYDVEG